VSIADLKVRLGDVPGIQNLTMGLEGGKIMLRWGDGYLAAVDAAASDAQIETAVRAMSTRPPLGLIPAKPAAIINNTPAAAPIAQEGKAVSNPVDAMNAFERAMVNHARLMEEATSAHVQLFEQKLSRQRDSMDRGFTALGDQIDGQTDAFEAMMARYTNCFGR
jgi:hypothetical protein